MRRCPSCGDSKCTGMPMTREVEEQKRYRVWMRSFPGFYEQYDGKVDVWAWNETDAEEKAFMELKRGAFPDRSRSMWRVEKVERLEA